jgi:hypothetical protein
LELTMLGSSQCHLISYWKTLEGSFCYYNKETSSKPEIRNQITSRARGIRQESEKFSRREGCAPANPESLSIREASGRRHVWGELWYMARVAHHVWLLEWGRECFQCTWLTQVWWWHQQPEGDVRFMCGLMWGCVHTLRGWQWRTSQAV